MSPHNYTYSRKWSPDDFRRNYTLTVWGNGTSCRLDHNGRSVYWQGDEAVEIVDSVSEHGNAILPTIWSDYEHLSEED